MPVRVARRVPLRSLDAGALFLLGFVGRFLPVLRVLLGASATARWRLCVCVCGFRAPAHFLSRREFLFYTHSLLGLGRLLPPQIILTDHACVLFGHGSVVPKGPLPLRLVRAGACVCLCLGQKERTHAPANSRQYQHSVVCKVSVSNGTQTWRDRSYCVMCTLEGEQIMRSKGTMQPPSTASTTPNWCGCCVSGRRFCGAGRGQSVPTARTTSSIRGTASPTRIWIRHAMARTRHGATTVPSG